MAVAPRSTIFDEITDFLASTPTPEEIIAFRPSEANDLRLHYLLDQNSQRSLTSEEREELDEFLRMSHLLKMIQIKARLKLASQS